MSNALVESPYQWKEVDEFNLLTAVHKIATEPAESYDPSINLFDRISKAMNKSIGYGVILNKVCDLQQRYHSQNANKNDRIFTISDKIWGSNTKNGESNKDGRCSNVIEKGEMEETKVEAEHLVRKCRKRMKKEMTEQKCRKRVKQEEPEPNSRLEVDNWSTSVESKHSKPIKKVLELRGRRVEIF